MSRYDDRGLYRFGEFSFDKGARSFLRNQESISLTPKEFQTLLLLLERAGEAVEREYLVSTIWPDTFVGDTSLARNISALRKHLGADAIQTVPKYGYRFSIPVTFVDGSTGSAQLLGGARPWQPELGEPLREEPPGENATPRSASRVRVLIAVLILAVVACSVFAVVHLRKKQTSSSARLALLPFRNVSGNASQSDYLSDGFANELTARLSRLNYDRLRVLARGSTDQYRNTVKQPVEVAHELGAQYLLEGRIAFDDSQARILVELVNGTDQSIAWTRQFARPLSELATVQEEIVEAVASATHSESKPENKPEQLTGGTLSTEAHDEYLRGRFELEQKTTPSERRAIEYFQRATVLDPTYSRAWEGISETYIFMGGEVPEHEAYIKAREAALTAIRLDDGLGEAHRDLAWVLFTEESDLQGAEKEYARAIELNPDDARAHHWYSQLLAAERRSTDSLREATAGFELDPRSLGSGYNYAFILIQAGRAQEGVSHLEELVKREPSSDVAWGYLGIGYSRLGEFAESAQAFEQAEKFGSLKMNYRAATAYALAMNGERGKAETIVKELENESAIGTWIPGEAMTVAYIGLGDKEKAFKWFQKGVEDRSVTLLEANTEPIVGALGNDPRFSNALARLRAPN